jgi:Domain of unknown function (DUF4347)/Bacterial Ig domain/Beta-propeller repeat/Bacterial cadherin-like domain
MARPPFIRRRPRIEEIEPRILYSADFSPALLDAGPAAPASEIRSVDADGEFAASRAASDRQLRPHELVFVDAATPDRQAIIDDIAARTGDERRLEVIVVDRDSDGIAAISAALGAAKDVSAIHIIGHGSDGAMQLGGTRLNFDSLLDNATRIKQWGDALAADADLLLYGCNVAQSADGRSLMEALARLTGADVAASNDPTGAGSRGGDWDLEARTGPIEAACALSAALEATWDGLLDAAAPPPGASPAQDASVAQEPDAASSRAPDVASIALAFERNAGQAAAETDFIARGSGYALALSDADALLILGAGDQSHAVRLDVVREGSTVRGAGENPLAAKTNYLVGTQDQWLTDIDNFGAVRYSEVYQGIDLRYYGNQRQLEYDFLVDAGADVGAIALRFDGVQGISIADNGDLVLALDADGHSVAFKAPVAYQDGPDGREAVGSRYILRDDGTVGFEVDDYDASRQLVIDPVLAYGTYFGSTGADVANGLAVDAAGNVYIAGYTPGGSGGLLGGLLGGGSHNDVFVAKFSQTLNAVVYSTLVGGGSDDYGTAVAVDASGRAFVTGYTKSSDFPTVSAFQSSRDGGQDAFVFKLNAAGSALTYSTYLGGGGGSDVGWAIAVDAAGSAYVAGVASSSDFPLTAGAADITYGGGEGFVTKLSPAGSALGYSTFVGGNGADTAYGIAIDAGGNAVVVGSTASSSGMPLTGAFQPAYGGGTDAFVARLNSTGTAFTYGSYLGGSGGDIAYNVALDGAGKIYVTGETASANFATTPGALQTVRAGGTEAFLTIIDPNASGSASLVYSTFLGGSKTKEAGLGVGVDAGGRVYVSGQTDSGDFPVTAGAHKTTNNDKSDAFFVILNPLGTGAGDLVYGTYYGGTGDDYATIALYSNGKFYLAGYTVSASGIATSGAYDTSLSSNTDAFVSVFSIAPIVTTSAGALAYTENAPALVLDSGAAVSDPGIASLAGAMLRITANYANGEDVLAFNNTNPWGIIGAWDAATGTLTLLGNSSVANYQAAVRSVTYQNTSDRPSTAARTVSITVSDGVLSSAAATRQINVTSVNDPPVNTVPGAQTTAEDTTLVFSAANGNAIALSDVDAAVGAIQVTLSVTNGKLTLDQTAGLTFVTGNGAGNPTMTFTGTIANVNAALGGLRFDPNADFTGGATLTLVTNDQGNSGSGGALTATSSVAIAVTPVNDAPLAAVPGSQSTGQDTPLVFSAANGNALTVSDVDAGAGIVQLTLTAVNGTVTLGSLAGLIHSGNGTGSVQASGTLADLNAALDGLTFTPAPGYIGADGLTLAIDDGGNSGAGGPASGSNSVSVIVSPNVAPTVTASGTPLNYSENAPAAAIDPGLTVSDPDSALMDHALVRIAGNYVNGEDVLEFTAQLGITGVWNAASGTLTLSGAASAADYQSALRTVAYRNTSDNPSTAPRTVTFVVNDGISDGAIASCAVAITAQNDGPSVTAPPAQTMSEDAILVFSAGSGNEVRIGDTDAGGSPVRIALSATNGTLTLAQVSGLTFASGADGSSAMEVVGTSDDINAALSGLRFQAAAEFHGSANVHVAVDDQGGSGAGGALAAAADIAITVDPVNDAPSGSDATLVVPEDAVYVFAAADFGFTDPADLPADTLTAVRIASLPTAGRLTLNGVDMLAGQFVDAADIAAGKLAYIPPADANGIGIASFTFQVQDDGGTAIGGVDLDPTARTITFDATAVDDAPIVGVPPAQATTENVDLVFSTAGGNAILVDDVDVLGAALQVTLTASNGTLTLSGTAGLTFVLGTGSGDATMSFTGTRDAVNAALDAMRFTPIAAFAGAASVGIAVSDLGNTGAGGPLTASDSVAVTIDPVNHAPAGADKTVAVAEDGVYVFAAGDFGFSDPLDTPPDALLGVVIATVPGAGSLLNDGVAIAPGQFVALADIAAGKLQYLPAADANGAGYASFAFQVQDDGGTAGGGADLDPTPNTITIDVTPVNDAPAGTDKTLTALEDTEYVFSALDFGFTDPADGVPDALAAVRIASLPAAGSLALSGVAVAAGQSISAGDIAAGNLRFTLAAGANGAAYASFTFQVQDDGGTAGGGADLDPTPNTIVVDVTAVNDAPAGTDKTVTTLEDVDYVFTAADFGFTDAADSPASALAAVRIASAPTAGTLTLSGAVITAGEVTFADIAAGRLKFTPGADANGIGYASFTFQVRDDGGTANGGVDLDPFAHAITIDVTAVSDAPAGTDAAVTVLEDGVYTFSAADFGFTEVSDSPADAFAAVTVASLPGAGSLTLSAAPVLAGQSIAAADIVAGKLHFTPAADANGAAYASFTFQVQDSGATANGGADLDPTPNTITVDVTAVNDGPAGTDRTLSLAQGGQLTFSTADFGFTDANDSPADAIAAVRLASLPAAGSLMLSGTAVTTGQSIAASDIAAGRLKFTPAANGSGTAYASFSFLVQDSGGTANGGSDLAASANTITMDLVAAPPPAPVSPPAVVSPAPPPAPPAPPAASSSPPPSPAPVGSSSAPATAAGGSSADGSTSASSGTSSSDDEQSDEAALAAAMGESEAAAHAQRNASAQGRTGFTAYDARGSAGAFLRKVGFDSSGPGQGFSEAGPVSGELGSMTITGADVAFKQASPPPTLEVYRAALSNGAWVKQLDSMRDDVSGQGNAEHKMVASTVAITGAMSVGYVIWLLRGGLLLSSLLSSLPAWHVIDPMPVLARSNRDDDEPAEDDDPLEKLFGRAKAAIGLGGGRGEPVPAVKPAPTSTETVES